MATLWEIIQKQIKERSYAALTKGEEIAKVGKLKMEIATLHRRINHLFSELGGKVYHQIIEENNESICEEVEVQKVLKKLKRYEDRLHEKEERLEKLEKDL